MNGLTLKDVLHKVVFESKLSARQIAEELGISYSMLTNAAHPELDTFKFAARYVIPITKITGDFRLLDFMEQSCGRVAFALPEIPGSKVQSGVGDAVVIGTAIASATITGTATAIAAAYNPASAVQMVNISFTAKQATMAFTALQANITFTKMGD